MDGVVEDFELWRRGREDEGGWRGRLACDWRKRRREREREREREAMRVERSRSWVVSKEGGG